MISLFKKTTKTRAVFFLLCDLVLISASVWLAFLLRFEGQIPVQYFATIKAMVVLALIFSLPIFYFLKLYSFSWTYVSAQELISLIKATSISFFFLTTSIIFSKHYYLFEGFPRSTLFISYFLVILFSGGIRFAKRIYLQIFNEKVKGDKERTLIVGAGDAGEQILRSIQTLKSSPYLPLGFVDDGLTKQGIMIHGLPVLGKISDISKIVQKHQIEEMIIALPSAGVQAIRKAVEKGREAGLQKIKIVPSMSEIINSEVSLQDLKEVQMEDLLRMGREPVSLDTKAIENFIKDKKILITGAAGSIGSELSRQVARFKPSLLLLLDQDETGIFNISEELKDKFPKLEISTEIADIQDKEKIEKIFSLFQPNIVFHSAAYKHVPLMEKHPDEAIKNNVFGTRIVAEAALEHKIEKLVFISTDKAINPSSVMGATKRAGEMICQALNQKNNTKFVSVRFGNVLDSRGSVIPIFREQIKKGGPVEVTNPEMKRYFMSIPEACLLVMQAGEIGQGGEVFVLDMGEPITILDLAKKMIRLSGFEPDKNIPIVFTGSRPGEKLFEEILTQEEETMATQNQNIFIAKLSSVNEAELMEKIEKLKNLTRKGDKKEIVEILKILIPSYKPDKTIFKI